MPNHKFPLIFAVEISKFELQIFVVKFQFLVEFRLLAEKIQIPIFRRQISIFELKFDFSGFGGINGFFANSNFFWQGSKFLLNS